MPQAPLTEVAAMTHDVMEDARSTGAVERLMEDSWEARSQRASRRETLVETGASTLFLVVAIPLAVVALSSHQVDPLLACLLVLLYAISSRMVQFPIGAGYVVPSYMVLVPMLLLLPPGLVPLLTAAGLVLGSFGQAAVQRTAPERVFLSISDAWHTLGPATVLLLAVPLPGGFEQALIYAAAFAAGCLIDLVSATAREAAILGVESRVQIRVIALVWLIDACIAPFGLLVADAARQQTIKVLFLFPINAILLLLSRERTARIAQAQRRLDLVAHERARLQSAVARLGEALAAKLDLDALADIVLRGSVEALDADAGRLIIEGLPGSVTTEVSGPSGVARALQAAFGLALANGEPSEVEHVGVWARALPLSFAREAGEPSGALAVAREGRAFRRDEQEVMQVLVERASHAAGDIIAHQMLREQALTDALTKLGNRHRLTGDLEDHLARQSEDRPLVLILFDLDGFKGYNDTFGHLAGDAMLARLGSKLAAAVSSYGTAYRLGGDEFCALVTAQPSELDTVITAVAGALQERGENFAVGASYGAVLIPHEAATLDYALQLADERMYARKKSRPSLAADQTRDVLVHIMRAKQPSLESHSIDVARLCLRVGRRYGMTAEELDELERAALLHDVGKVGVPDAILEKPDALESSEWDFIRQHPILGERILNAAPAMRPVAVIVRATHERWDGGGYPDGLAEEKIPLGARIIAVCDAYDAMTTDRCYRGRRAKDAACRELRREAGRQFDPDVVGRLLEELHALEPSSMTTRVIHAQASTPAQDGQQVVAYLHEALARHKDSAVSLNAP